MENLTCKVHSNIKPLYIMNSNINKLEKRAVLEGVKEVVSLTEVDLKIIDFDIWRNNNFKNLDGSLIPYCSVDWYIKNAKNETRNQIDGEQVIGDLACEPWRDINKGGSNHYDLFILDSDLYYEGTNFVFGLTSKGIGSLVSTYRFKELDDKVRYDCIKTAVMHELGHLFGLVPETRSSVNESLGIHCNNICIMRQGLSIDEWINITNHRLEYGILCSPCSKDLKDYFKK